MIRTQVKVETRQQTEAPRISREPERVPRWVLPAVTLAVFAIDIAIAGLCFVAAFKLRTGGAVLSSTAWAWSREFVPYAGLLLFAMPVRAALLVYQRVYRFQGEFSYTRELAKVFKAVLVGSLLLIAWAFLFRGGFAFREFSYSRGVFILDFVFALAAYSLFHALLRLAQTWVRRRDVNLIPTLVVGGNSEAEQTIRQLRERPDLGYRVVGVVMTGRPQPEASFAGVPVAGPIDDLARLIAELQIQEVIITDDSIDKERLFEAMMRLGRSQRVEFRFAPSLFNVLPQKTSVEQLGVLPMVRLFREPLSDAERFLKRASDIAIAALAMLVTLPVWLAAALWIKLDSRGPVLFKQERVGMDGRIFLCYKFRTMHAGADESIHRDTYRKNIAGIPHADADGDEPLFGKIPNDPRITRAGRWLRRSSIDELPQLLNVLRGDMSIVGPRPPIPYEVEDYDIGHRKRLEMKPGITGLWQVSGRSRLSFEEMVRVDLYYIENWSIWLDLKIVLLTLPAILRGEGAR
ncbi:MAG: sugar transferase [Pyrinomonadaceae bacterium]